MTPLTSQQKLQIIRELDNKISLGFSFALSFFDDHLNKLTKERQEQFKKMVDDLNIKVKELNPTVINGKDGYTPIKGIDYADGKNGRNGKDADEQKIIDELARRIKKPKDGKDAIVDYNSIFDYVMSNIKLPKDGKDGSPDTPIQIADKLNTLTEKIDRKVIKGLEKWMESIMVSLREKKREKGGGSGGGGGMGNVVTQSTSINSATTTITLTNKVASQGKAIWFNYQGQQQAYGTHFTVSGNVITLLFTPQDDTFADIIYIRG